MKDSNGESPLATLICVSLGDEGGIGGFLFNFINFYGRIIER
jgi:hypothetical protein